MQSLNAWEETLVMTNEVQGPLLQMHYFRANLQTLVFRLFTLACSPKHFVPLVLDYWTLARFIWDQRQPEPDLIYPMLGIRRRQSGRLARLILEHSRDMWQYERHATTLPQGGIDPPCVTVIDLDETPTLVKEGYSTQVDLHGLMCMMMFIETILSLIVHVLYLRDQGWVTWLNWASCVIFDLGFCMYAVLRGDGTLTLTQRSDASAPGCAVLLVQDLTVVLHGSQSIVEAIAESSFNLSHPNSVLMPHTRRSHLARVLSYQALEAFCEGFCIAGLVGCLLLFRPSSAVGVVVLLLVFLLTRLVQVDTPESSKRKKYTLLTGIFVRIFPSFIFLLAYEETTSRNLLIAFQRSSGVHVLSLTLLIIFWVSYRSRNYPIRTSRLLHALGHPPLKKWEFDTLAAAATFQCLVICRDVPRPIQSIDVLAMLNMFVPDQRDVWVAWKERLADRIVHEVDISFAPTIPVFRDARQRQLKDLLDQAQLAYDMYLDHYH